MTKKTSLQGCFTALVTPFHEGGLDEEAFRNLVEWQIAQGIHGLVPVATTGEGPTLSHDEHQRIVKWCVDEARGRVPVIAGAGSNSTPEAIDFSRHAENMGADAVLIVTSYYNAPTREGLFQHYKMINDAIGIPIIIYNIPGRSVVDISLETMKRLYELRNRGRMRPTIWGGGHDWISVTSNVAPRLCADLQNACLTRDYATALELQDKLTPLHVSLFVETNPAPVKFALSLIGKCSSTVRLPMVPVGEKTQAQIREAMQHAGLIN